MKTLLTILVIVSALATFGTMFMGVLGLGKDSGRSNRFMRYRVLLQGLTVALFLLLMLVMRG